MRRLLAATLLLAFSTAASAQVLDDDIEFDEHHVATIDLDEDSPVLEGVGLSREIGYEVDFEGTLYLSAMAEPRVDPFLRLETIEGKLVADDDNSGGGKHAFLKREVHGGEAFVVRVVVKGHEPARVRFKLFEGKETEATRAAAKEGELALADAVRLRKAGQPEEARRRFRDVVASLRETSGRESSTLIAVLLWRICIEAYQQLQDLFVSRDACRETRAFRESALPNDHPDLLRARGNLAVTMSHLGELHGARALEEKVLEVFSRTLPDDHPELQTARLNLAVTKADLGDLSGARALEEKVLEVFSRTLPDDHPLLQKARANLARAMRDLGDLSGTRALQEKVLEVFSRTLPDDHPDLQIARLNLAWTMTSLGDLSGARVLLEKVLEVFSRTLPDDHPDLQAARLNLAWTMTSLGDLSGARVLLEKALEVFSRTLPDDHPDLQLVRVNLARTKVRLGEPIGPESLALVRATAGALEHPQLNLSGRELELFALERGQFLGWALSTSAIDADENLRDLSFQAVETVRLAAAARERLLRSLVVPESLSARRRELDERLAYATAQTRQRMFDDRQQARSASQDPRSFFAHIQEQDRLERELANLLLGLARDQGVVFRADRHGITTALRSSEVAVGYWRYQFERIDPKTHEIASPVPSYLAFVLKADASVTRIELGPADAIEEAVKEYREVIGLGAGRGAVPLAQAGFAEREHQAGERVRALVLDPLRAHLGDAKRIIVALDDVLHVVPLGALPLDHGTVGARYDLELRTSLKEITVSKQPELNRPSLLGLGGIKYDREGASSTAEHGSFEGVTRGTTRYIVRTGPWELGFSPLPETRGEVVDLDLLFHKAFETAEAHALLGEEASRDALSRLGSKARFVHLATHGYFTPESAAVSMKDDRSVDKKLGFGSFMSLEDQVRGFAPMELCGLAFAGANQPPNEYGLIPGVMTAEEISHLDLRGCELVVLSACDTNVGVRRAGQGIASLQQAVYAAGARASLTSLWKVPDEATRELMVDFYLRMWLEKKPKRQALFEAQEKMRTAKDELGRPRYRTRDWAAWVLVGEG